MSKRRQPGELVIRCAGSGFLGAAEPSIIKVPEGNDWEWASKDNRGGAGPCMICNDPECKEYPNLQIVQGPWTGEYLYHISECEMSDYNTEP